MRVEVGEGPEGLQTRHEARHGVSWSEDFLEAGPDCLVSAARKQAEETPVALEEAAERLRDNEHEVTVWDWCEDLLQEFLREERRAFGLAGRAEVARATRECDQVFALAGGASKPGEAIFQTSATQECLGPQPDNRTCRPRFRLEAFLVSRDVTVEVLVQDPIERGALGMPWPVDCGSFGDEGKPQS